MSASFYDPKKIEPKWQKYWDKKRVFETKNKGKKKFYVLVEFPYPSGDGLHVGHVRSYTALDILAHKKRREGFNVLYPMGWDAFGLPAENYAIKTGIHPKVITKKNTSYFKKQLKRLGISYDWNREINTTDPAYYKWTQWIFLQLFKKGLAYKSKIPINWCLNCKIGLANEEVVDGRCERCGGETEKRDKEQWMLEITKYADRLYDDLDLVDYLPQVKTQQRNWIGRSLGFEVDFTIEKTGEKISVFTTRIDTIFGVTHLVLAPEHSIIKNFEPRIKNYGEVEKYTEQAKKKTDIERVAEGKEKSGVRLQGLAATNPANGESIPIFVSDYVLASYGTGAIMAVPAHDKRDFEFAKKFNINPKRVIDGGEMPYEGNGNLVNSGSFNGRKNTDVLMEISKYSKGRKKTTYKLRDWVFSRQRYWGEPIPLIFCEECALKIKENKLGRKNGLSEGEIRNPGWFAVSLKNLPIKLPNVKSYKPGDEGESPLSNIKSWINVKCPRCKGTAKRESDVMPNWAGSSWYYLRYIDPKNKTNFADKKLIKYWIPVDWYNGGMEHTTLHLLYSRFWHKFLYDEGHVTTKEPYAKRTSHGLILAENGEKMSKSKGNVINPDSVIERVGADTLRLYEMFMGPFDHQISWSVDGVVGSRRFIEKVWRLHSKINFSEKKTDKNNDQKLEAEYYHTVKKVSEDIENLKLNTAISQLMIFSNSLEARVSFPAKYYEGLLMLLAPFAPHACEELWFKLGKKTSIHLEKWPVFKKTNFDLGRINIAIQVNGKVRASLEISKSASEAEVVREAKNLPAISKWLLGKVPEKVIYVQNKIINFVVN